MDGKVRSLRDQFVTHNWSEVLYNGTYFSPERELIEVCLRYMYRPCRSRQAAGPLT